MRVCMRKGIIYEGSIGESLEDMLPSVIDEARESDVDVFVHWNGVTVRVTKYDTVESLMEYYEHGIHLFGLASKERRGEILTKEEFCENVSGLLWGIAKGKYNR